LVQRVLDGAESKGIETELLYIGDYQIGPCRACNACKSGRECVQDDDMRVFYSAIGEAKVLVLGTPIYFDHITGQTKVFLDRLYAYLGLDLENRFPKDVKCVLVVTWEASNPEAYDDVIAWLQGRLSGYFGVETVGVIKAANTEAVSVDEREDLLGQAFDAGVSMLESSG